MQSINKFSSVKLEHFAFLNIKKCNPEVILHLIFLKKMF